MFGEIRRNIAFAFGKADRWLVLVWVSAAVTLLLPAFVHAGWTFDVNSYTFVLEPQLVAGDVFYQHWANESSNPSTYLHSGNMRFDSRSWYNFDAHVLRSSEGSAGSEAFADYRLRSADGNIYAVRSTTWHNANQQDLTLDHYNAYSSDDGANYTDYYLNQNWNSGNPPGSGFGDPGHSHSAQDMIDSPGKITRIRYGLRDLTSWDEWYGGSWRVWAGSSQTQYHDNYVTDPFAEPEGGPVWSESTVSWIDYNSGSLANSSAANPTDCIYLVAHHGAMTGIDIRLTSTDLGSSAEAVWTPSANVHLHLAIATQQAGPYTDIWVGDQFVPNSANPGAYVNLIPYSKPELLFIKIYSTKDAGDSYYIRWGGFHVEITAEDPPPDPGPETCRQLWDLTPPNYAYRGDLNDDCNVDLLDLACFVNSWLLCNDPLCDPRYEGSPYGLDADLDQNCFVDGTDFAIFSDSWQKRCDTPDPTTTDRPFREILGVSCHFNQGNRAGNIDLLTDLEATWVRDGLTWAGIEKSQGVYCIPIWSRYWINKIHDAGLNIIMHLGYENDIYDNPWDPNAYADYAAFCTQRLRGKIQAWHCINEPHNFGFSAYYGGSWNGAPPSPWIAKYAELVRLTAAAAHQVAPEVPVMADEDVIVNHYRFLDEGLGPYVSASSWHPYGGPDHLGWDHPATHALPYQVADTDGSRASLIRRLRQKGQSVTGQNFEVYGTEMGWSVAGGGHSVPSEQVAANYLVRAYIISYAENMKVLCWYNLQDTGAGPYGLVDNSFNKRLTYYAYRNMAQILGDKHLLRQVDAPGTPTSGVQAYLFGLTGTIDENVLVLWSADDFEYPVVILGIDPGAQILDSLGNTVGSSPPGPLFMIVGAEPHYIVGSIPESIEIEI